MTPLEPETAVPAYFVALVEIHNPAGFQSYHEQFEATLAPFGGRLVSFGASLSMVQFQGRSTYSWTRRTIMKVFALGLFAKPLTDEQRKRILPKEVPDTLRL